jgi:multicomponent K+:H+ antiporter subunit E
MKIFQRSRFFPMPIHSLLLFVVWLLLNDTFAFGHIVLGSFLAVGIPLLVSGLATEQPSIKKTRIGRALFLPRVMGHFCR